MTIFYLREQFKQNMLVFSCREEQLKSSSSGENITSFFIQMFSLFTAADTDGPESIWISFLGLYVGLTLQTFITGVIDYGHVTIRLLSTQRQIHRATNKHMKPLSRHKYKSFDIVL